jgi:hypothetical protein
MKNGEKLTKIFSGKYLWPENSLVGFSFSLILEQKRI